MNNEQWKAFCSFRNEFKKKTEEWSLAVPNLSLLQKNAAEKAGTPVYPFETPVVYNTDFEKITPEDEIKLIVIGDNPGKDEQREQNRRYLCGQAGKIADGFFKKNPGLCIDFRKNVIILNKTPVHSAKTAQLKTIMKQGGPQAEKLILESQLWMAQKTAELHKALLEASDSTFPELWLVGYSELKGKGFFVPYRDKLMQTYKNGVAGEGEPEAWNKVYVFQHFSMNRFTIDLSEYGHKELSLMERVHGIGELHKKEIFGLD